EHAGLVRDGELYTDRRPTRGSSRATPCGWRSRNSASSSPRSCPARRSCRSDDHASEYPYAGRPGHRRADIPGAAPGRRWSIDFAIATAMVHRRPVLLGPGVGPAPAGLRPLYLRLEEVGELLLALGVGVEAVDLVPDVGAVEPGVRAAHLMAREARPGVDGLDVDSLPAGRIHRVGDGLVEGIPGVVDRRHLLLVD